MIKRRRDAKFLTLAIALMVAAGALGRLAGARADGPSAAPRFAAAGPSAEPEWTLYSLGGGLIGLAFVYVRGLAESNRLNAEASRAVVENVFLREQVRDLKWELNRSRGQAEAPAEAAKVVADAAAAAALVLDTAASRAIPPHP